MEAGFVAGHELVVVLHYLGGWCRRSPVDESMWSKRAVKNAPLFDHNTYFVEAIELFHFQEMVEELPIEEFAESILKRTAGFDVSNFGANVPYPGRSMIDTNSRSFATACPRE